MDSLNRREMLRVAAVLAAAGLMGKPALAGPSTGGAGATLRFFPGFTSAKVTTSSAEINLVHAGAGPPLLLMHGAPQTHVSMRLIATELARDYMVIVPDLRGYGESSKPPDGENHANYSKRAMALDQVDVLSIWKERGVNVTGKGLPGGHNLQEDVPADVLAELGPFLRR